MNGAARYTKVLALIGKGGTIWAPFQDAKCFGPQLGKEVKEEFLSLLVVSLERLTLFFPCLLYKGKWVVYYCHFC